MSTNTPDAWVVVCFDSPQHGKIYKVLAGWLGGYLDGDSWKLSSRVLSVKEDGDYYKIYTESGSLYRCYKPLVRMTYIMSVMYDSWKTVISSLADGTALTIVEMQDYQDGT